MQIEHYSFGSITIDGHVYTKDVLLLPPRVVSPWWRKQGHRLVLDDLGEVLSYAPDVLVIGTGASGLMQVPGETTEKLVSAAMEVVVLVTEQACQRFAGLSVSGRRVAGAFHLTC